MDKMVKFSKEWFVTSAKPEVKAAAKNLKQGVEDGIQGNLDKNLFSFGEDLFGIEMMLNSTSKFKEMKKMIEQYGGLDNLLRIMDTDQDGIISDDETTDIAGADTPENEARLDRKFNAKDLQKIYENVMAVEEAKVEKTDSKAIYKFKDGTTTEVEYDESGNVVKSIAEGLDEDGNRVKRTYDAEGKLLEVTDAKGKQDVKQENGLKVKNLTDDNGRLVQTIIEGKKESENKTIDISYGDDASKTVRTETVGRIAIEKFDKDGNLLNKTESYKYSDGEYGSLDGVIDASWQSKTGDCWLLAGANSLARTVIGAKMIKDAIHINNDGTVSITLKGADRTYTYTPEQIMSYEYAMSKEYTATGDFDMNLIEMAVSDYRREIISKTSENDIPRTMKDATMRAPLEGGIGEESMFYLTGIRGETSSDKQNILDTIDKFAKDPERYAIVVNFKESDPSVYCEEAEEMGWSRSDIVEIFKEHAYTVSRVDDENVWVKDPKDSYWEIRYPKDKFFKNATTCSTVDLKEGK